MKELEFMEFVQEEIRQLVLKILDKAAAHPEVTPESVYSSVISGGVHMLGTFVGSTMNRPEGRRELIELIKDGITDIAQQTYAKDNDLWDSLKEIH